MNNIASSQLYSESLSTPRLRLHLVLGVDEVAHQTAVPLACATHVARTQQCAWWKVHGVGVHHVWPCPLPLGSCDMDEVFTASPNLSTISMVPCPERGCDI